MRSSLLVLPFLSFFFAVVGLASHSSLKTQPWVALMFWGLAFALAATWIGLENKTIRASFHQKGARHGASSGINIILGVLLITGLAFLSSRPRFNASWDVTLQGLNTLSEQSAKIIEKINRENEPVEMFAFFVDEMKKQKFTDLIHLYQRSGANFKIEFVDPQAEPTRAIAENVTTADTVIVKNGNQETRLTVFTEEKITNGLLNVLKKNQKSIYFTIGHGEKSLESGEADGFQLTKTELESERYQLSTINLMESESLASDINLLIISGPKYDFRLEEIQVLRRYLEQGRSLLVMVDALVPLPNLSSLLEEFGLKINNDLVVISPDAPLAGRPEWQYSAIVTEFDEFSPVTSGLVGQGNLALLTPFTRSIEVLENNPKTMNATVLARGSEINVRYTDVKTPDDLKSIEASRIREGNVGVIASSIGQVGGSALAASSTTSSNQEKSDTKPSQDTKLNREVRIVVSGSSQFASNLGAQRPENLDMFLNIVSYLVQDEDYIAIRPKAATQSNLDLANPSSQFNLLFFAYIYPFFFLGYGLFHWLKRRRA